MKNTYICNFSETELVFRQSNDILFNWGGGISCFQLNYLQSLLQSQYPLLIPGSDGDLRDHRYIHLSGCLWAFPVDGSMSLLIPVRLHPGQFKEENPYLCCRKPKGCSWCKRFFVKEVGLNSRLGRKFKIFSHARDHSWP